MPSLIEVRPFQANLGAATATGELFVTNPIEDSFVRGTLRVLELEDVSFEARVDTPFRVTIRGVTISISFDPELRAFTAVAKKTGESRQQSAIALAGLG
jgi:hypothetical protein